MDKMLYFPMIPKRRIRRFVMRLILTIPAIWLTIFILSFYVDEMVVSETNELSVKDKNEAKPDKSGRISANKTVNIRESVNSVGQSKYDDNIVNDADEDNPDVKETGSDETEEERRVLAAPNDKEEHLIDPNAPGEMGKAVIIDKDKLSPEERKLYDKGWKDTAFNIYVSDMISVHRTLPDIRESECITIDYGDNLPEACVIIIFHNEAWSVLLRTIHSVLDRSKPNILKEIVLVDDFSEFDHLKQPLQDYVDKLPKVQLVRSTERLGLIRARLMGFERCSAPVAIFLDSHCETTEGWLEPLVSRINENYTNVLVPIIDAINDDTFALQYQNARSAAAGGFSWDLIFNWHAVPDSERKRRDYKDYLPFRSPTMAGGLFAVSSKFFRHLGTYDSGMDIWGGENLELSFKTWMCGGTLETIPCSHVGHIFRKRSPYKWNTKGGNALKKNLVRLAEVWLDEFKTYFYQRIGFDLGDYGDISERHELRKRLKCKSFRWFLNEVYPEQFVPSEAVASGEIRNADKNFCADSSTDRNSLDVPIIGYPCHKGGGNQYWLLTKEREIRRDDFCWDSSDGQQIKKFTCHGEGKNQDFKYRDDDTIYNSHYQKCVELSWDGKNISLVACNGKPRQKWKIDRHAPKGPSRD